MLMGVSIGGTDYTDEELAKLDLDPNYDKKMDQWYNHHYSPGPSTGQSSAWLDKSKSAPRHRPMCYAGGRRVRIK